MAFLNQEAKTKATEFILAGKKNKDILAVMGGQLAINDLGNLRYELRKDGKLPGINTVRKPKIASKGKREKKAGSEFQDKLKAEIVRLRALQEKRQDILDAYGDERVDFAIYLEKHLEVDGHKIALIEELMEM
jgi:hypothetical protein